MRGVVADMSPARKSSPCSPCRHHFAGLPYFLFDPRPSLVSESHGRLDKNFVDEGAAAGFHEFSRVFTSPTFRATRLHRLLIGRAPGRPESQAPIHESRAPAQRARRRGPPPPTRLPPARPAFCTQTGARAGGAARTRIKLQVKHAVNKSTARHGMALWHLFFINIVRTREDRDGRPQ